MTPFDRSTLERSSLDRRQFLLASLASGAASLSGCATPLMRGQTPEVDAPAEVKQLEIVGDLTRPYGLNWLKLESVALVTNLPNTGSDPPPGDARERLKMEMMTHQIREADKILASPTTSLVLCTAYLPPGVQKGDTFDVQVRVPSRSQTTSLRGGWLMQTRMRQLAMLGGSVRSGSVDGLAQGDLTVDAVFDGSDDKVLETRARVLGGGVSALTRQLGLAIAKDGASVRMSTLISRVINDRFHTFEAGIKKGVATAKRDNYLELDVSPRYKHNLARYLRVIRNIVLRETPVERVERLTLLEKKLQEPATAPLAALQLEALGSEGIPALKVGVKSNDPEVRFYAAEALAYLDEPEAAAPLSLAARDEAAFRWHALSALASMTHVSALDALSDLLHAPSVETRYGAFRALRTRNAADPATKGELLEKKFRYHVIPTTGEPLVHVARSRKPEIVIFGHEQRIRPPKFLFAGREIMVTALENGELKVGRFEPGQETRYETCPPVLDRLIRTIVSLGGGYAEVIQCLQEARQAGCLESRLAVEALPRPNRKFYRDDDPLPEAPPDDGNSPEPGEGGVVQASAEAPAGPAPSGPPASHESPSGGVRRAATPSPEMFTDGLESARARQNEPAESKATPGQAYVAPEYSQPKPGLFDRLNPLARPKQNAE
jgi:flagellar basal body P-ring protein FlgI